MASIARQSLLRQTALAASRSYKPIPSRILPSVQAVSFHTTSRRDLLPPGPQVVKQTMNDPVVPRHGDPAHGSVHWNFERILAMGLVPVIITPFATGSLNPVMDATLCAMILVHSHMGFQNVIADYVPATKYPRARKLFNVGLGAATLLVGAGLYEFETNDVGMTEAIKRVWTA